MRQATAYFLVFSIVFQAFYNAGVTAFWLSNRAYIAATLCENRDKPEMKCGGKCYLKKKIADSPDTAPAQKNSKFPNLKKGIELAELKPETLVLMVFPHSASYPCLILGVENRRDLLIPKSVFHPPAYLGLTV